MKILGIESSCDETAAAVIDAHNDTVTLLSNITATSAGVHARTGGVIPEQAARKQIESIIPVIDLALHDAFPDIQEPKSTSLLANIDAIAVTVGPGLIGSLLVGVETAKAISLITHKPIIPVNHLVGHIYANFITSGEQYSPPSFPALALVVSGGHTDLILMNSHTDYKWIGGTRDDAAGEAFDKTARLLGFDYPGGPLLSAAADNYVESTLIRYESLNLFPRPMINENNYDWSFSGLKTAVLREIMSISKKNTTIKLADYQSIAQLDIVKKERNRLAAEIQEAVVDVLVEKTLNAIDIYTPKSLLLAGGVSANKRLRIAIQDQMNHRKVETQLYVPKPILCTDNAAYIATCAYFHPKKISWNKIDAKPDLSIMDIV